MTKLLTVDEMLDCARLLDLPERERFQKAIEELGTELAQIIAQRLDVKTGNANNEESAFGGTCAPFMPSRKCQPCPYPLNLFDRDEWDRDD